MEMFGLFKPLQDQTEHLYVNVVVLHLYTSLMDWIQGHSEY